MMLSDSEKVLNLLKWLHFSSYHAEYAFKQAQDNLSRVRPGDTLGHLEYYRACIEYETYNRIFGDICRVFGILPM